MYLTTIVYKRSELQFFADFLSISFLLLNPLHPLQSQLKLHFNQQLSFFRHTNYMMLSSIDANSPPKNLKSPHWLSPVWTDSRGCDPPFDNCLRGCRCSISHADSSLLRLRVTYLTLVILSIWLDVSQLTLMLVASRALSARSPRSPWRGKTCAVCAHASLDQCSRSCSQSGKRIGCLIVALVLGGPLDTYW